MTQNCRKTGSASVWPGMDARCFQIVWPGGETTIVKIGGTGADHSPTIKGAFRERLSNIRIYRARKTIVTELDYIAARYGARLRDCTECE